MWNNFVVETRVDQRVSSKATMISYLKHVHLHQEMFQFN